MPKDYQGINYAVFGGFGDINTNRDPKTAIHYGVIPHHHVGCFWYEESEAEFGCSECDDDCLSLKDLEEEDGAHCGDYEHHPIGDDCDCDPIAFAYTTDGYKAFQSSDSPDIFVELSPYYTYAQFCSPCAPGACYLLNPIEPFDGASKAYCLGPDCFDEDNPCPYPVWHVSDETQIYTPKIETS
jgi:hypothetical protein